MDKIKLCKDSWREYLEKMSTSMIDCLDNCDVQDDRGKRNWRNNDGTQTLR